MLRNVQRAVAVLLILIPAGQVRAQYGGYGWGGWGSSYQGDVARGMGGFYAGRGAGAAGIGAGNEENAVAGAINTTTAMRWNNALYQASRAGASRYNAQNRAQRMDVDKDRAQVRDRIADHPEELDITDGNTLNLLMTEILSPANAARSLLSIRTPLRSDILRDIPFEDASEDITFCMHQLTMDGEWPLALRGPNFQPERDSIRQAMATALKADEKGDLDRGTIAAVSTAVDALRVKFEATIKPNDPDYYPALTRVRTLAGLTKMLHSPKMDEILAELEDYQGTTLGDLLAFMQSFNLRFAPANSFRQKQIYRKLYPMLNEQVRGPSGSTPAANAARPANAAEKAGGDLKSAATDLFKDMKVW